MMAGNVVLVLSLEAVIHGLVEVSLALLVGLLGLEHVQNI